MPAHIHGYTPPVGRQHLHGIVKLVFLIRPDTPPVAQRDFTDLGMVLHHAGKMFVVFGKPDTLYFFRVRYVIGHIEPLQ